MRAPPPVDYPSVLSRPWRGVLSLLVGASMASLVAWVLPRIGVHDGAGLPGGWSDVLADPVAQAGLALATGGVACIVAWLSRASGAASQRTLRWDGQDWVLAGGPGGRPDQRGDAALMLDLGP